MPAITGKVERLGHKEEKKSWWQHSIGTYLWVVRNRFPERVWEPQHQFSTIYFCEMTEASRAKKKISYR